MAMVRRHWALVIAIPILVVAMMLSIYPMGGSAHRLLGQVMSQAPASTAAQVTSGTDLVLYQRVQALRMELALTQEDLAALGLSQQAAATALNLVKTFATDSNNILADADHAVNVARASLSEANRKVNVGPRNEAVIASVGALRQNLAMARIQRDGVLASLVSQINSSLTGDQQAIWAAARANADATYEGLAVLPPGPYRYVAGLTDTQIQRLDSLARTSGSRALADAGSELLSPVQSSQLQTVQQNQRSAIAAIAVAEAQVLPVPDMLKAKPSMRPPTGPLSDAKPNQ